MRKQFNIRKTQLHDFEKTAKNVLEHYYLVPYPAIAKRQYQKPPSKRNIRDGRIARPIHGAIHASRVAAYVDHFHQLHTKHDKSVDSNLKILAKSLNTTPESLLILTKYAALFHDSARQDEGKDYWDGQSAENGRRFLVKNGIPEHLAALVAAAAEYKGSYKKFTQAIQNINTRYNLKVDIQKIDYLRTLIADADCLDIIRVRNDYELNYLNFYTKFNDNLPAYQDLLKTIRMAAKVIEIQNDALHPCNLTENGKHLENLVPESSYNPKARLKYEQAENPYVQTVYGLVKQGFQVKLNAKPTETSTPSKSKPNFNWVPYLLLFSFCISNYIFNVVTWGGLLATGSYEAAFATCTFFSAAGVFAVNIIWDFYDYMNDQPSSQSPKPDYQQSIKPELDLLIPTKGLTYRKNHFYSSQFNDSKSNLPVSMSSSPLRP